MNKLFSNNFKEVDSMSIHIPETIIQEAEKIAKEMLANGEEIRDLDFGQTTSQISITLNPNLVDIKKSLNIKGAEKTFYIGWRKQTKT